MVSASGAMPVVFEMKPSNKLEMVDMEGTLIKDDMGSYDPITGDVQILKLNVQATGNATNYIKVFGIPANESAILPKFSGILKYDASESTVNAVTVTSRV
jgi:hypothetical protein